MCFGVRKAVVRASSAAEREPLTTWGDLVHNDTILQDLRARGVKTSTDIDAIETGTVMVTAHGVSDTRLAALRARGLRVLNATCPLVRAAHRAVAILVDEGCHPVVIGQRHHAEVRGLTEDLDAFDVVLRDEDVLLLAEHPKFGIAAQTTQPAERVEHLAELIRRRFPASEVQLINTVCSPTRLRQHAAEDLARQVDVVVVVGGVHSNNTRELADTCRRYCARVHLVQTADDVRPEWFAGVTLTGITAGTSTPDNVIDEVESRVQGIADSARVPWLEPWPASGPSLPSAATR
jgi:4-hydroxy-3-methylbut-2-en-1-yl diphosphate reductase